MNKIKKYRTEQNMTLGELSKKVGISAGYLCHLEKGTRSNPTLETMVLISLTLDKSIYEIFCID